VFVSGPPPGVVELLRAVSSDEGQLVSLAAITEAHTLLAKAKAARSRAVVAADVAVGRWDAARLAEELAVAAQLHAEGEVNFYQVALGQLGLAEYTGASSAPPGDLAGQESELDQAELAEVAASTTTEKLNAAEAELAADERRASALGGAVQTAWSKLRARRAELQRAGAQLVLSEKDVGVAHRWALEHGTAPLYPTETLLKLEGPLGRAVLRMDAKQAAARATTPTTMPGATPAATLVPGQTTSTSLPQPYDLPSVPLTSVATTFLGGQPTPALEGPSILGPSLLTGAQVLGWFESTGARPRTTTSINQLVWDYMKAGRLTGVRADIAFAQSIVETGHFSFPRGGQVARKDNNFAGIGACDTCKSGWSFPSAMAGVMAQEQLLQAYATPPGEYGDVSPMAGGVRGCCTTWLALSGVWATNPNYGYEIMGIYKEMLDWAIPRQLLADDLITQSRFEQEELQLPAEDARTYALVASAITADKALNGASGRCKPSKTGTASTTTTGPTTTTSPQDGAGGPTVPAPGACPAARG
jgi:hypothetical protein